MVVIDYIGQNDEKNPDDRYSNFSEIRETIDKYDLLNMDITPDDKKIYQDFADSLYGAINYFIDEMKFNLLGSNSPPLCGGDYLFTILINLSHRLKKLFKIMLLRIKYKIIVWLYEVLLKGIIIIVVHTIYLVMS